MVPDAAHPGLMHTSHRDTRAYGSAYSYASGGKGLLTNDDDKNYGLSLEENLRLGEERKRVEIKSKFLSAKPTTRLIHIVT